jgi:organic radical activating enzyme
MKIKPSEGNKTFCMAPWTHTYLSPQSERRMCCASREKATWATQYIDSEKADTISKYQPLTLDEHWNSEYMMNIRKRLMSGEEIPQCEICNDKILNLYVYRDYFTKTLFPNKIDEAFEKTREDGYTEMKPISYDYRITNLCNFKCRMCGDQLSSQWEAENRMMGHYENGGDAWAMKQNKPIIDKFQKEVAEKELWDSIYDGRIEEIYWVGGEPLMWDIHWDVMKYLVDNGQSKNVTIRYNTNLSRVSYKGINLYDLLPHFKNVNLAASIDGTSEIVEYVRSGIKWDTWLSNFKQGLFLKEIYNDDAIVFDLTLTAPGLFSVKELFDLAIELDVKTYIKTTFAFDSKIVMSPLSFPKNILTPIIDDILEYIEPKLTQKTQIYKESLIDLKNRKSFDETYPDYNTGLKIGKERLNKTDIFRKDEEKYDNILKKHNIEAYEWWKSI